MRVTTMVGKVLTRWPGRFSYNCASATTMPLTSLTSRISSQKTLSAFTAHPTVSKTPRFAESTNAKDASQFLRSLNGQQCKHLLVGACIRIHLHLASLPNPNPALLTCASKYLQHVSTYLHALLHPSSCATPSLILYPPILSPSIKYGNCSPLSLLF